MGRLIVVDNGSQGRQLDMVREAALEFDAILVSYRDNLGVGVALNEGARRAVADGYDWLLTLDQDTWPDRDLLEIAARAYRAHPRADRVALVASTAHGRADPSCRDRTWLEQPTAITSGTFVRIAAWIAVGEFREDFFIDAIDIEYSLRVRGAGWQVIRACRPAMTHAIGSPTRHTFPGRHPRTSNHSALRRYYMARNGAIVWRLYAKRQPLIVLALIRSFAKVTLKLMFYEEERQSKLTAIARGLVDGFRGRLGKPPPHGKSGDHV